MKFTVRQFNHRFPTSDACLEELKRLRYADFICPKCERQNMLTKIAYRPQYACPCGHQVSPLAGTIFNKSSTDLRTWFYVMYLVTQTRAGISAKQVERETGVSYKCAWRIMKQIRSIMGTGGEFTGDVETDETFLSPKANRDTRVKKPKRETVVGVLERSTGQVVVRHIPRAGMEETRSLMHEHVQKGSTVHTDGHLMYQPALAGGYIHKPVIHWSILPRRSRDFSYFTPSVEMGTQGIENFWGVFKRGIRGTYIHVSPKYLQNYVNEYAWRYSFRKSITPMFELLLNKATISRS